MKKSEIITAAAITAAITGTIGIVQHVDALSTQYKTTATLCMRKGPGTNYPVIKKLALGQTVTVVSIDRYGWAKLSNGYYVSSLYLKRDTDNSSKDTNKNTNITGQGVFKYTKNDLNLRKEPNTNSWKIMTIRGGQKVKVIATYSSGWSKIIYNNAIGYVASQYLTTNKTNAHITVDRITVSLSNKQMNCYSHGKLVRTMRCAVGKSSTPTPRGYFKIVNKIKNRPYYKGHIAGGAPNNPLGKYWLGLKVGNYEGTVYAIHGNNNESSIGKAVSNGCIRLHNSDIEWLFNLVTAYDCTVVIY